MVIRPVQQDKVRDVIYSNVPRKEKKKRKDPFALHRASVMFTFQVFLSLSKVSHSCSKQDTA